MDILFVQLEKVQAMTQLESISETKDSRHSWSQLKTETFSGERDNKTTLNVGISINGGEKDPGTLEERELYINTQTSYLFAGNGAESKKVNCGTSDKTKSFSNNTTNTELFDTADTIKVGNFSISKGSNNKVTWNNDTANRSDINTYNVFENININKLIKLILTNPSGENTTYGKTLPTTGTDGQIFFKLVE